MREHYATAQGRVLDRLGLAKSAASLLDEWSAFVEECEACYVWDVSEYRNEIGVRDQLATILEAPELQEFDENRELAERVGRVDATFRSLLMPDVALPGEHRWWRTGVLRRAGRYYAEYFRADGIPVEVCEP